MDVDDPAYSRFSVFDDATADAAPGAGRRRHPAPKNRHGVRGVGWVLRWAAALAILIASLVALADFAYRLAAEQTLARAARAAALEATLPYATYQSIADTAERRLHGLAEGRSVWQIYVEQNGTPVRGVLRPQEGDRLTVMLAVPSRLVLPRWLHIASAWQSDRPIEARAERHVPTHRLGVSGR